VLVLLNAPLWRLPLAVTAELTEEFATELKDNVGRLGNETIDGAVEAVINGLETAAVG
jgi:hypothetical protein